MKLESGRTSWTMSPQQHVKAAVANVEEDLAKHGKRTLPSKHVTPFLSNCAPWLEQEAASELNADGMQLCQEHIGQLRWIK